MSSGQSEINYVETRDIEVLKITPRGGNSIRVNTPVMRPNLLLIAVALFVVRGCLSSKESRGTSREFARPENANQTPRRLKSLDEYEICCMLGSMNYGLI